MAVVISWVPNGGDGLNRTSNTSTTTTNATRAPPTAVGHHQGPLTLRQGSTYLVNVAEETDAAAKDVTTGILNKNATSSKSECFARAEWNESDATINDDGVGRREMVTAIGHLTARQLHDFLFGEGYVRADNIPSSVEPTQPGRYNMSTAELRRPAKENMFSRDQLGANKAACTGKPGLHTLGVDNLNVSCDNNDEEARFVQGYPRRSEAAAKASFAGGGYVLLQKYVAPSGERNSTLRCQWTPTPAPSQHAAANHGGTKQDHDLGTVGASFADNAEAPSCHGQGRVCDGGGGVWQTMSNVPRVPSSLKRDLQGLTPNETPTAHHWKDEGKRNPLCPKASFNRSLLREGSQDSSRQRFEEFSRVPERPSAVSTRQSTPAFLRPSRSSLAEYGLMERSHRLSVSSTSALRAEIGGCEGYVVVYITPAYWCTGAWYDRRGTATFTLCSSLEGHYASPLSQF